MISFVIPTLNEEKCLPLLLESLKEQSFSDFEIIIADAGSTDKTLEIAKKYNCKVSPGGLPSKGRNEGAKLAQGSVLFFLDADVFLQEKFLEKAVLEFEKRNLDLASFCLSPISKNKLSEFLFNFFYNYPAVMLENILPHAAMGIMVKKDLFWKVGGFDESIKLAEDHYLARQAKKAKAKIGIIKSVKLFASERRFKKDGWISVGIRYFLCEMHMIFIGPVRSDIFKYKFDHYDKTKSG